MPEYVFSVKVDGSIIKQLEDVSKLCGIYDNASLLRELLDGYLREKTALSAFSEDHEDVETEYDFIIGEEYVHSWSKGEKTLTVKFFGKDSVEILSGSDFNPTAVESLEGNRQGIRGELLRNGSIENGKFVENVMCSSLSAAVSIARGTQLSGPQSFKKKKLNWISIVEEAIRSLGGEAHLNDIYKEIETKYPYKVTPHYKDTIRNTIYRNSSDSEFYKGGSDHFKKTGGLRSGIWSLR